MPNLISWYALHPRAERLILDANQLNFILNDDKINSDQLELPLNGLKDTVSRTLKLGSALRVVPMDNTKTGI